MAYTDHQMYEPVSSNIETISPQIDIGIRLNTLPCAYEKKSKSKVLNSLTSQCGKHFDT